MYFILKPKVTYLLIWDTQMLQKCRDLPRETSHDIVTIL